MSIEREIQLLEEALGYPLSSDLKETLKRTAEDGTLPIEFRGQVLCNAVDWEAELFEGESPLDEAWEKNHEEKGEASIQRVVIARHFTGLLSFQVVVNDFWMPPGKDRMVAGSGDLMADLNTDGDVYYRGSSGFPACALFDKPRTALDFALGLEELAETNQKKRPAKAASLQKDYPLAAQHFSRALEKLAGVTAAGGGALPSTPQGERIVGHFERFLPIADVLIARADGTKASLSAADAKAALALAEKSVDFPPSQLLGLLAAALSGDGKGAKAAADGILSRKSGAELTRRWAKKVQEGQLG